MTVPADSEIDQGNDPDDRKHQSRPCSDVRRYAGALTGGDRAENHVAGTTRRPITPVCRSAFDPQGQLWGIEHGTNGGDELNRIEKGKNYGWPVQAYGEEYSGSPISGAATVREGIEQPVYYWDPVIAPSGAQFYTGDAFPAWKGNLFIGGMKDRKLVRLVLDNNRVTGEEHLLEDRGQRVRDVRQGPDGALYIVTDERKGELWRIAPRR
jgi:aldose sugar dehydrogenase